MIRNFRKSDASSGPAIGALFAGYGGLDLGVSSVLGGHMAWCAEVEAAPSKILAHHWPDAPNLGDVTKVDWASVPKVDIITGGSPCQDLSHAGKRAGMKAGTRSGLWASMCDAIDIIRPSLVVWENVRGALSAEADSAVEPCPICVGDRPGVTLRALGRVLGDLAELRYDAWWYGLRAADVGAAHGRFRVFVFATPADADDQGLEGRWQQTGVRAPQAGAHAAADRGSGPRPDLTLLPTPACNDMGDGKTVEDWDAWTARMQAAHGNGNGHGKSLAIEAQRLLPTPTAQLATNGGSQHPDKRRAGGHQPTLADEAEHVLLPTPTSSVDSGGVRADGTRYGPSSGVTLTDAIRLMESDQDRPPPLLPTPVASDGHGPGHGGRAKGDDLRTIAARHLLPTPRATDGTKGGPNQRGSAGDLMLPSAVHLLNTPTASDARRVAVSDKARELYGATTLGEQVQSLLPTPAVADSGTGRTYHQGNPTLLGAVEGTRPSDEARHGKRHEPLRQDWREYGPAVARQEAIFGRPAPLPTEATGRAGAQRLSPRFVEWLMGLPEGHVTDPAIGLSRNDQLKALGNGVVPQQAAAALLAFLADTAKAATEVTA